MFILIRSILAYFSITIHSWQGKSKILSENGHTLFSYAMKKTAAIRIYPILNLKRKLISELKYVSI